MPYSTIADLDSYSRIDNDTLVPEVKFSDTEKNDAITQADARIDYIMKDWATFYASTTLTAHVTNIVKEVSIYYALYILFDKKAKIVMLMNSDVNNFGTGDMNAQAPDSDKKAFYVQYQALSQIYKVKAEELITLVVPPGSDSIRSTFDFQTSDAMES
jgi:hypothetical protein